MAGGPGAYVFGAEEKKELMDVIDAGYLFRYGTPGVDGFQGKVATFERKSLSSWATSMWLLPAPVPVP